MSILRDLFIFGFTGYSLYTILNTKAAQNWIENSPHSSYFHGSGSEVDQIRVIAMTVSVVWMVIFMLRMVVHLARTAFKLFLVLSIVGKLIFREKNSILNAFSLLLHVPVRLDRLIHPPNPPLRTSIIILSSR